ncbi:IQ domain-containing protein IQM2 [Heracleum sosnowskyi]|uniref:IQ domain-containing protein IQM2 n=1 Tax=Heracleum sosnowskyi TaxID=360622 RepID=A0AAD8GVK2_9APIA|nr:IQ domain-containing protein IQM2 [Heracleum sosnowskyi]
MGIQFSCPLACYTDLENGIESVIIKSINFGDDETRTPVRSISFKDEDNEPTIMQSVGSVRMLEGSVSFKSGDKDIMNSFNASFSDKNLSMSSQGEISKQSERSDSFTENITRSSILGSSNPKHQAAIKLQKVYKSFRTRRKLADCAVLIEQSWWKLLDFAELKHSSVSFFDIEKHETAISRWSRARTRAAKVGKGLSQNNKARKLALQHWLEAIDPRHRYGHNLHFYYVKWLHSQSIEPFFYWLDIGEGKEVNLVEKCPRSKLQQQCIKYLGPMERLSYEVVIEGGKFLYKQTGDFLDTTKGTKDSKWIFVLSTSRTLYVGIKKKGTFQHSSFLAGGATLAAGRITVEDGTLKVVWPHSGHYRPTPENFQDFVSFLKENVVDISDVKMDPIDEEDSSGITSISHLRSNSSDEDINGKDLLVTEEIDAEDSLLEKTNSVVKEASPVLKLPTLDLSGSLSVKLPNIEIPKGDDLSVISKGGYAVLSSDDYPLETPIQLDGYETAEESFDDEQKEKVAKEKLFAEKDNIAIEETVTKECILERINSRKRMKSFQLGKQLSCKWSTGAGPRIGCVRDYPSGLQSHALEQVNLSPRSAPCSRSNSSSFQEFASTCFSGVIQGTSTPRSSRLFREQSRTLDTEP